MQEGDATAEAKLLSTERELYLDSLRQNPTKFDYCSWKKGKIFCKVQID